ncbi:hypothetical protein WME94_01295 [Sorangium sp. So ce429]
MASWIRWLKTEEKDGALVLHFAPLRMAGPTVLVHVGVTCSEASGHVTIQLQIPVDGGAPREGEAVPLTTSDTF